jgi:hypothetical protein
MMTNMQFPVVAIDETYKQDTSNFEKTTFAHANTECPICLEPIVKQNSVGMSHAHNVTVLGCHHAMCTPCFVTYIQQNHDCPICRNKMFTMNIAYNQKTYVIPIATALGQRIQRVITPQESLNILHQSGAPSLRSAPPLSSPRAPRRAIEQEPVRYYRRRRNLEDYYDEDYDIEMTEDTDHSNGPRSSGRAAGLILLVLSYLAFISIWLIWKNLMGG